MHPHCRCTACNVVAYTTLNRECASTLHYWVLSFWNPSGAIFNLELLFVDHLAQTGNFIAESLSHLPIRFDCHTPCASRLRSQSIARFLQITQSQSLFISTTTPGMTETTISVYIGDGFLQNVIASGSSIHTEAWEIDSWRTIGSKAIYVIDNGASTTIETITTNDPHVILPSSVFGRPESESETPSQDTSMNQVGATATARTSGSVANQTGQSSSFPQGHGLSNGAIIAIAVVIPVVVLAAVAVGALFYFRHRRKSEGTKAPGPSSDHAGSTPYEAPKTPQISELHHKPLPHEAAGITRHELYGYSVPAEMGAGWLPQRPELKGRPLPRELKS